MKKTVLLGAGGHARVIIDTIKKNKDIDVIGFTEKSSYKKKRFGSYPVLGDDSILEELFKKNKANYAFISLGSTGDNKLRRNLYEYAVSIGYKMINVIHNKAVMAGMVSIEKGNALMATSVVNPGTEIGVNNIINTGAIIEHDCSLGNHIHVSPGAILAGEVRVGDLSHIGLGAKVIEGIKIGRNCLIGAGAVIVEDIPDNSVVVGVPGRIIRKRSESDE